MSMDQGPITPGSASRARPRSRGFSFGSNRSGGSGSKDKSQITESPQDKARRDSIWRGTSKANPNAAINEAQPGGMSSVIAAINFVLWISIAVFSLHCHVSGYRRPAI